MDFFEGLIAPDEPDEPQPETHHRLGAYRPGGDEPLPPADWFLPAQLPQVTELGVGPDVRIMLTGWQVWPGSVTLRLGVFLRTIRQGGQTHPVRFGAGRAGAGALRFGVLLADGRRVTTLDGHPWPAPTEGPPRPTLQLRGGGGGGFHYQVELHLSQLPPEGPMQLVAEWPDQGVPETRTEIDATVLRAAAAEAVEIWPESEPPPPAEQGGKAGSFAIISMGPSEIMAQAIVGPAGRRGSRSAGPPPPTPERSDWEGMGLAGWQDIDLVRTRLAHGADPVARLDSWSDETPLHRAAEHGVPEVVAELLRHVQDVDVQAREERTPLWEAVCHGKREAVELLLAAGADAWSPQMGGRSPGRLALTTELAPLFEALPNAVLLTPDEHAAQEDADRRAAVFHDMHLDGLSVAFVASIDEETAIRRLGADPAAAPVLDLDREPGPYGTGPNGFDPDDYDLAERFVGVTGVPGGCVLIQPAWYYLSRPDVLNALSPGTTAYGLYFNPKGGTFGEFSRDGRSERHEEMGSVSGDEPDLHWLYRFWQWDKPGMWGAHSLAYASHMGGIRVTNRAAVVGPPRRWAEIPEDSELLS